MRPIPPQILALYPMRRSMPIPDRPWWVAGNGAQLIRSDYARVGIISPTRSHRTSAETIAACTAYDAEHPMPHPGFRVGQTWAWMDGDVARSAVVIWLLDADRAVLSCPYAPLSLTRDGAERGLRDDRAPAWLLADPCCQHLAPWGPA